MLNYASSYIKNRYDIVILENNVNPSRMEINYKKACAKDAYKQFFKYANSYRKQGKHDELIDIMQGFNEPIKENQSCLL